MSVEIIHLEYSFCLWIFGTLLRRKKSAAVTGTFDEVFPQEAPSSEAVMKSEKLLFSCEIWNKTPIAGWLVELNMRIFPKCGEHHIECLKLFSTLNV